MKKCVAMTLLVMTICAIFSGCFLDQKVDELSIPAATTETTETTKATETTETKDPTNFKLEENPSWKYERIEWGNWKSTAILPVPDWTWWGYTITETETEFWGYVGYSSIDDYDRYIEMLKDSGFNLNCEQVEGSCMKFWGENENGYGVTVTMYSWCHYFSIHVNRDLEALRKNWEA